MSVNKILIILAVVAVGAFAAYKFVKVPQAVAEKVEIKKEVPKPLGIPPEAVQKMPSNAEVDKLNGLQAQIAQMSDEAIAQEMESIKRKAQESGVLSGGGDSSAKINADPQLKDMLMRMALLRVEKARRDKKTASGEK